MKYLRSNILLLLTCLCCACAAQEPPGNSGPAPDIPAHFFSRLQNKIAGMDDQLTHQTDKMLQRLARREARMQKKLSKVDSNAARSLFAGTQDKYWNLSQKLGNDTANTGQSFTGEYKANTDSLQNMLKYLNTDPSARAAGYAPQVQSSLRQFQTLQAKMQDADQIKEYIRQRKQQISQYITQHAGIARVFGKDYQDKNQELYYYSQRLQGYKNMLNDPDRLEKEALSLLSKLPAWQAFMKQHSQLAGLFNLPGNYASPQTLAGLQTRDQVAALIQRQVAAAGSVGGAALQANIQSAQTQLQGYKDKLRQLGGGSGDIDMPDFKPNDQKTKTFWRRLEYGTNFQTTRNNYAFPTVSDLGLSVGYKLNNRSTVGVGASFKLGWGNGIQHIAFSGEGAGLRSFVDVKIKGSWSVTGGLEYNYTKPFSSFQRLHQWNEWTKSGLIGVSKTVSMRSRVFKKTKVQLMWDFLSYQQMPRTQAVIFRIGYDF